MKSWLFWVHVASEFIILFSLGFLGVCVLFVVVLGFFKNTVVCAGYVDFSAHAEILFENIEVLFHYYCLAAIQLAVFFPVLSLLF